MYFFKIAEWERKEGSTLSFSKVQTPPQDYAKAILQFA